MIRLSSQKIEKSLKNITEKKWQIKIWACQIILSN